MGLVSQERSVLKDYITSNDKLQKAVEIVYKRFEVFSEPDPILGWDLFNIHTTFEKAICII